MTSLYAIADGKLRPAVRRALSKESMIEDWVAADPAFLGLDALIIGRQVPTDHGKFIDLWSDDPTYIVDLIKRVTRVNTETVRIVSSLPPLNEQE